MKETKFKVNASIIGITLKSLAKLFALRRLAVMTAALLLPGIQVFSQTPYSPSTAALQAPGTAAGSYRLSNFEQMNISNGKLSVSFDIAELVGRAKTGYDMNVTLGTGGGWNFETINVGGGGIIATPEWTWAWTNPGNAEPDASIYRYSPGRMMVIFRGDRDSNNCISNTYTRFGLGLANGQSLEFTDLLYNGQLSTATYCNQPGLNRGREFVARDGSGIRFISDVNVIDGAGATSGPFSVAGGSGFVLFPDGTKYRIENGTIIYILDKNGNKTTFEYEQNGSFYFKLLSVTDANNRKITIEYNINHSQYGLSDKITYKGTGGADRSVYISRKYISNALMPGDTLATMGTLFPEVMSGSTFQWDATVLSEIWLPDGRKYKLLYNSYGDIARVELPTGGAVEYASSGPNGASGYLNPLGSGSVYRRLNTRRSYSHNNTLIGKTEFSYADTGTPYADSSYSTTEVRQYAQNQQTLLAKTKHYFYGIPNMAYITGNYTLGLVGLGNWRHGREFQTDWIAADGSTLLQTQTYKWEQRAPVSWWTPDPNFPNSSPLNDPRITEVKTTLSDTNQVSLKKYAYDDYNNITDIYDYDWGGGGAVGSLIRRSHVTYKTSASYINPLSGIYLPSLPEEGWVSTDLSGANVVSLSKYEYDNYTNATNSSGTVVSNPLYNRTGPSGHDSSAFSTSYLTRGNVTKIRSYENAAAQSGELATYYLYDILGNIIKTVDGKGQATSFDYEDAFGAADSEAQANTSPTQLGQLKTYGFVTNITNPLGHQTHIQYDYFTGATVNAEDVRGNVTANFYNDNFDRLTQSVSAINRPLLKRQTTTAYDDINRRIIVTSDSKAYNDNLAKSESYYDGQGRAIEIRQYETATDYIASYQEYDSLGRLYKSSHPFRPNAGEQAQWTTLYYDSLGRTVELKTQDNASVTRSYSGNTITVTDQRLRKRSATLDALGRISKIVEDPSGLNYETSYLYDVFGRLRKTTQTQGQVTQNRYFMYNDLGLLIRARQSEQNANGNLSITDPVTGNTSWSVSYAYDKNGNLVSTADANNRTVTGTYDQLNRLTARDYSDSTPDIAFTYDDPNIPNSKGQLTAVASSVSSTFYTSFDELGRIRSSQQVTNGQTFMMPDYSYDWSGALVSQTYPSGKVVTTETDLLGRIRRVAGQNSNQAQKTFLNNISYTAFGAVEKMRLGNGAWESAQFDNKRLQIKQIGLGASAGSTSYLKLEFDYGTTDNNGSLRQQKITVQGMTSQLIQDYTYDMLNRLESAKEIKNGSQSVEWKQTFTYDRFGNRRFDAANTTTLPQNNGVYNPQIDQNTNRFTVAEGYNYDSEGNITGNPENQLFSYDAENRQTQVQNTSTQTTANYYYDGSGRRVRKTVGSQETVFVYDAFGKLIAEYTTNQAVTTEGTKYLTIDALGSPRAVTGINGKVVSRHDYMPFGEEIGAGVGGRTAPQGYLVNGDGIRQQFTGYERDAESGLDYAQSRYFSGRHGRFTSVDPLSSSADIRNPQTFNRYSYVLNSPYKFVDPLGMSPCPTGVGDSIIGGSNCTLNGNNATDNPPNTQPSTPPNNTDTAGDSKNGQPPPAAPPGHPSSVDQPAMVGITNVDVPQGTTVNANGGKVRVEVTIKTSSDSILKDARVQVELRQTTNDKIKTDIVAVGGENSGGENSENNQAGNATIIIKEPGRPATAVFEITVTSGESATGNFNVEADIKSVRSADGAVLDSPTGTAPNVRPAPVTLMPRTLAPQNPITVVVPPKRP